MTTAFAHVARGRILRAFVVQPAGALAALACLACLVAGAYTVVTSRPPSLMWLWINPIRTVLIITAIITASWLWLCLLAYLKQK